MQRQIDKFEKHSAGPKIDLAKKQMSKARQMKPKVRSDVWPFDTIVNEYTGSSTEKA